MSKSESNEGREAPGLLSRWARNKSLARDGDGDSKIAGTDSDLNEEQPADAAVADAQQSQSETVESKATGTQNAADGADLSRAEADDSQELILTDEDMPPLETLTADSDFSGFMNKGISPELRRKALQHLFRMPKFNIRDGLNDYDEDYTYFEPLGDTITSDMRWHTARKEREEREAREAEEARIAAEQNELQQGESQAGEAASETDEQPVTDSPEDLEESREEVPQHKETTQNVMHAETGQTHTNAVHQQAAVNDGVSMEGDAQQETESSKA